MRLLTTAELNNVSAAKATLLSVGVTEMEILVTYTSKYVSAGTFYGHRLNVILYADEVHDLFDKPLNYNLSTTFSHNGHLVQATAVPGGHIYKFIFDEG